MNTVVAGNLLLTAFALLLDWMVGLPKKRLWSGSRRTVEPKGVRGHQSTRDIVLRRKMD